MHALIEADGLTKRFGKIKALDGLDLTLPTGQVVAILGPNGAGKTTFIRTVATLLRPDGGTLRVAGHDVVRESMIVRRRIGLAGQSAAVEQTMTGRENLNMIARLYGQSASDAACQHATRARAGGSGATPPTGGPGPTRAACAGASTLPPAWSVRRGCFCSTSPRRARSRKPYPAVGRDPGPRERGHRHRADDAIPR